MSKVRIGTGLGLAAALLCAPAVVAASADGASIAISGRVPTVCRVSLTSQSFALHQGENTLGDMIELCNSTDGYRVTLNHPRGLNNAWVLLDGQRVAISPAATHTVIVDSPLPADRQRQLRLVLPQPVNGDTTFSLDAEVKGTSF